MINIKVQMSKECQSPKSQKKKNFFHLGLGFGIWDCSSIDLKFELWHLKLWV